MTVTVNLTDPPLGLVAAGYSNHGLAVLPCAPGDKPPLWGLSWEDASADPEQVTEWWGMEPRANIGVACIGDLVVLDVDGEAGERSLAVLEARYGALPYTHEVHTGRGRHLYFLRPAGLTDGWRWLEGGLELKANGYVLAPPSVHPSGAWYWSANGSQRAPLVEWLKVSPRPIPAPMELPTAAPSATDSKRLAAAAQAALDGELEKLGANGREAGTGRHTRLYAAAAALGHHVAAGGIGRTEVESALWQAAAQLLGLPQDAETAHQIEHGMADGMAEPYVPRERPLPRIGSSTVAGETPTSSARMRNFATMTPQLLEWLWAHRIPLGKLTVLAGLPGQGKSLLTCWLAARASRGELDALDPMDVCMVSAEDDPEDTILPRLLRCGADLRRISFLDVRDHAEGEGYYRSVALPADTKRILSAWRGGLLILDPIGGLLDANHDGYKAQHVRAALGPLKQAAEERRAAVVLIQHLLTKAQTTDPLAKLADSHAYAALPRSVLLFGPDPEDEQDERGSSKVLLLAKSNVAGRGEHGLRFSITDGALIGWNGGLGWSAGIRLNGPTAATAADSLASGEDRSALREAIDFLRDFLGDGPQRSAGLRAEAESQGISERTLKRARQKVCGRAYREGEGPWMVALSPPVGPLGPLGPLGQASGSAKGANGAEGAKGGVVVQFRVGDDPEAPDDGVK